MRLTVIQTETELRKTVCKPQPSPLQQFREWDQGPAEAALSRGSAQ